MINRGDNVMKRYRVYVGYRYDDSGYQPSGTYDLETLENVLDFYINQEQQKKQILVIEEDHINNSDFPVFCYQGKETSLQEFLDGYVKNELQNNSDMNLSKKRPYTKKA